MRSELGTVQGRYNIILACMVTQFINSYTRYCDLAKNANAVWLCGSMETAKRSRMNA